LPHVDDTVTYNCVEGVVTEKVRIALVKLCAFLNEISQKAINPRNLVKLQHVAF
jgi:hypothetical protein